MTVDKVNDELMQRHCCHQMAHLIHRQMAKGCYTLPQALVKRLITSDGSDGRIGHMGLHAKMSRYHRQGLSCRHHPVKVK